MGCRCRILRRLHFVQLLYIVVVVIVYTATFGLLLPLILHGWPYSPYYNSTRNNMDVVKRVVWVCLSLFVLCRMFLSVFLLLSSIQGRQLLLRPVNAPSEHP